MPVDERAWFAWLNEIGSQASDGFDHDTAEVLLNQFRHSPSPQGLIEICVGQFFQVTGGKVVRADMAEAEAAQLRRAGHTVRVESAPDLPGKPARITILRRKLNFFDLCQRRSIRRLTIVSYLEDACRWSLGPNPVANLALGRSIFQPALMTGHAPISPTGVSVSEAQAKATPSAGEQQIDQLAAELTGATAADLPALDQDANLHLYPPNLAPAPSVEAPSASPPAEQQDTLGDIEGMAAATPASPAAVFGAVPKTVAPVPEASTQRPAAAPRRRGLVPRPRPEREVRLGFESFKDRF